MKFIRTAKTNASYNATAKAAFHSEGKAVLRKLAKALGLTPGTYDIRSNMGGIAVSGEVTLHGENLYVQFAQSFGGNNGFMWRTCKGRKDYTGGRNNWSQWEALADLDTLAATMNAANAPMFQVV